jgi:hypothetical protein
MSDSTDLERHYRRLLALYPRAFRREHEDEMISVLIAGAADDQRRPRPAEAANLVGNAILMRLLLVLLIRPSAWEYRHARLMAPVRVVIGIWLLVLTAIIYGYGLGGWWGVLLVPAAALHFYFAYRVRHPVQR